MPPEPTETYGRASDADDPLGEFRRAFRLPENADGEVLNYLCGNSLGLQPNEARDIVEREMGDWAERAVRGHFEGDRCWYEFEEDLAGPMAEIVGAERPEVTLMNTLTVNLHLMMVSFYRPVPERNKILVEESAFPSDRYAVTSQIEQRGFDPSEALVEVESSGDGPTHRPGDIERAIYRHGDDLALALISGVHYYTGECYDLESIAAAARDVGARVGFDLAHAAGNVELDLHGWGADFAVWCTYKYLNGGPGAVAGCFVHDRHSQSTDLPRFAGWWGNDPETRFEMAETFEPRPGAAAWKVSNPPILSLAPLEASLAIFERATMSDIRDKSVALTEYLLALVDDLDTDALDVVTPRDPERRGAQISLNVGAAAEELHRELGERGIVCDLRRPGVIRVAPAPLYNTFEDIWRFVRTLEDALEVAQ